MLVGHVFSLLPLGLGIAHKINLMSGFFSALAVAFMYLTAVRMQRTWAEDQAGKAPAWLARAGAACGALFFAFSTTFWNNAIEAEVYALSSFTLALTAYLSVVWYEMRDRPASATLMLLIVYLMGMSIGFHMGSILVFPGVFVLVLLAQNKALKTLDLALVGAVMAAFVFSTMKMPDFLVIVISLGALVVATWRSVTWGSSDEIEQNRFFALIGIALFVVGLSVHLFMMIRAHHDPLINQTDPTSFDALMSVLRREQYPPRSMFTREASLWWQLGHMWGTSFWQSGQVAGLQTVGYQQQFTFLGNGVTFADRFVPLALWLLGVFYQVRGNWRIGASFLTTLLINSIGLLLLLNFTDSEVRETGDLDVKLIDAGCTAGVARRVHPTGIVPRPSRLSGALDFVQHRYRRQADLIAGNRPRGVRLVHANLPRVVKAGTLLTRDDVRVVHAYAPADVIHHLAVEDDVVGSGLRYTDFLSTGAIVGVAIRKRNITENGLRLLAVLRDIEFTSGAGLQVAVRDAADKQAAVASTLGQLIVLCIVQTVAVEAAGTQDTRVRNIRRTSHNRVVTVAEIGTVLSGTIQLVGHHAHIGKTAGRQVTGLDREMEGVVRVGYHAGNTRAVVVGITRHRRSETGPPRTDLVTVRPRRQLHRERAVAVFARNVRPTVRTKAVLELVGVVEIRRDALDMFRTHAGTLEEPADERPTRDQRRIGAAGTDGQIEAVIRGITGCGILQLEQLKPANVVRVGIERAAVTLVDAEDLRRFRNEIRFRDGVNCRVRLLASPCACFTESAIACLKRRAVQRGSTRDLQGGAICVAVGGIARHLRENLALEVVATTVRMTQHRRRVGRADHDTIVIVRVAAVVVHFTENVGHD